MKKLNYSNLELTDSKLCSESVKKCMLVVGYVQDLWVDLNT